jgi:serine/threonine protein kinase
LVDIYIGRPAAVKIIDISRRSENQFNPLFLMESFEKEIKMAYKMRQETRHVVTIYGFDFSERKGLLLMAMELGGDTLSTRIERLHGTQDMKRRDGRFDGRRAPRGDFIPARERKSIWVQLVNIVQTLHRHQVVSKSKICGVKHIILLYSIAGSS